MCLFSVLVVEGFTVNYFFPLDHGLEAQQPAHHHGHDRLGGPFQSAHALNVGGAAYAARCPPRKKPIGYEVLFALSRQRPCGCPSRPSTASTAATLVFYPTVPGEALKVFSGGW